MNTDQVWKHYGQIDPYFGVITKPEYHSWALTDDTRREFLRTGEQHVVALMRTLREINPGFFPARTIDFGCGVGRVTLPLARESASVLGVDVSPGMLAEAQRNAADSGVQNVRFSSEITGRFDLVHAFMVLQHISPRRGKPIVRELLSRLDPGGMVMVQIPYDASAWLKVAFRLLRVDPVTKRLRNLVKGRALNYPALAMFCYSAPSVLEIFHNAGVKDIRIELNAVAGSGVSSMTLYGWKREN